MSRIGLYFIFSLTLLFSPGFIDTVSCNRAYYSDQSEYPDSLSLRQNLYNGRVWRDLYSHRIEGDQYLFSNELMPGSVTFNGRSFKDIQLRYDICNDEIVIVTDYNILLQLNKEMVEAFSLEYGNTAHFFTRLEADTINSLNGYVEVLYKGSTALYIKHVKEISRLTQGRMYDIFIQLKKIYILKDGVAHQVSRKHELISLLGDKKQQIRNYIKINKLRPSKKSPENIAPVLRFYDSLNH